MYSTDIFTALNVSSVTSTIDRYIPLGETVSVPALFNDVQVPEDCSELKTINFYQIGMIDLSLNYIQAEYSVNCRAATQGEVNNIADAVITAVNRVSFTDFFTTCQVGAPIPPIDPTDVYNIPVQITFKKRS